MSLYTVASHLEEEAVLLIDAQRRDLLFGLHIALKTLPNSLLIEIFDQYFLL